MRSSRFEAMALPSGVDPPDGPERTLEERGVSVRYVEPAPEWMAGLTTRLRGARRALADRPAAEIAATLATVGERFLDTSDTLRMEALDLLPATSGLSPEMSAEVLGGMARGWTEASLMRLLSSELGHVAALAGFTRTADGESMAVGPSLCVQLVAGTVPGVAVSALIRSLLVKGPTLVKPGRGDVVLPVLFARALSEVDRSLGDALGIVYWPGGRPEVEGAALSAADIVTVYGSDETVGSVRARAPVTARVVAYHHRVSVGLVGRAALEDVPDELTRVAADVAASVALFDQRGCVSPQIVYVEEGGELGPTELATALARALAALENELPAGRLDPAEASALHQARGTAELMGPGAGVEVIHGGDASWTVLLEREPGPEALGAGRVVRIRPVRDAADVPGLLEPLGPHLQTVGVAGLGDRLEGLARALGAVGASRVAPFAAVAFPPAWWHHDGRGPLVDLVRWVDLERG